MRAALAGLLLGLALAGCNTVRPVEGSLTPLGKELDMRLPVAPGYPEKLDATQTVVGQYGERRAAFQAILMLSPKVAEVVLTTPGGPRILSIKWTEKGIVEDRTPLAPEGFKGVNVLGDIFVSMWPLASVRAALPPGVTVEETGSMRTVKSADRTIAQVETFEKTDAMWRQKLTNLDFGYNLTIITETGG